MRLHNGGPSSAQCPSQRLVQWRRSSRFGFEETSLVSLENHHRFPQNTLCFFEDSYSLIFLRSSDVTKPISHLSDPGNLLIHDLNPVLRSPSSVLLNQTARDCVQSLLNDLLTTCPIQATSSGAHMKLPKPTFELPREKPLPTPKPETKWEKFAKKKGIKDKRRGEGKMEFDEEKGEWVPKWGYKGRNKDGERDWIVELDGKKPEEPVNGGRSEGRKERKERVRRNERKMRANQKREGRGGRGD